MKVLALDLSLTATGIALWDGTPCTVNTRTADGDQRLVTIRDRVRGYADTPRATLAVIEDLPTHAHGAGITGMVHGAVRVALADLGVPYVLVPPASLKKYACGKGNATKPDMRMSLFRRADLDLRDDNQVDAAWLRFMALDHYGQPVMGLPQNHRDALAKVQWPNLPGSAQ